MRIIIAGGGIAGLACAVALAEQQHDVLVLERRAEFAELGAGIQLAPNGFRALQRLGLAEPVLSASVIVDRLAVLDGYSGQRLVGLDTGEQYRSEFGFPYAVVQRTDLYQPLLQACADRPRIGLRADAEVVSYRRLHPGVQVNLRDGASLEADALIGADGIRSLVRQQVLDDGEPRVSGHTIYRSVVPMSAAPARWRLAPGADPIGNVQVTAWAGHDWHLVHYPIARGAKLNLAITRDDGADAAVAGLPVPTEQVRASFADVHPEALELIEAGADWRRWVLCDRPPVDRWSDGEVLLVGDAAHPMLQYAAQGAAMALEDAALLADRLPAGLDRIEAAFTDLVAHHAGRTAAAHQLATELGRQVYHCTARPRAQRNAWLAGLADADVRASARWLHGSDEFFETSNADRRADARVGAR